MKKFDTVLFDFDGTVMNTKGDPPLLAAHVSDD